MKLLFRFVHQVRFPFSRVILSLLACTCTSLLAAETVNLSGDWIISSSVGGATPITVNCTLVQDGDTLSGACTPVMENPQPSELSGNVTGDTAQWGYDVMFNGNPGRVDFNADSFAADLITGTLSLSGTEAPFKAERAE